MTGWGGRDCQSQCPVAAAPGLPVAVEFSRIQRPFRLRAPGSGAKAKGQGRRAGPQGAACGEQMRRTREERGDAEDRGFKDVVLRDVALRIKGAARGNS